MPLIYLIFRGSFTRYKNNWRTVSIHITLKGNVTCWGVLRSISPDAVRGSCPHHRALKSDVVPVSHLFTEGAGGMCLGEAARCSPRPSSGLWWVLGTDSGLWPGSQPRFPVFSPRSQSGTGKTATFSISVLQCLDIQVTGRSVSSGRCFPPPVAQCPRLLSCLRLLKRMNCTLAPELPPATRSFYLDRGLQTSGRSRL